MTKLVETLDKKPKGPQTFEKNKMSELYYIQAIERPRQREQCKKSKRKSEIIYTIIPNKLSIIFSAEA